MGQISLQQPQIGLPDTTEDVKIQNNFTTLQNVINGNIDDTNLKSPLAAYRNLMFQATGVVVGGSSGAGDFLFSSTGVSLIPPATNGTLYAVVWVGDAGLSGQPTDFQVVSKAAKARVRGNVAVNNNVAPAATFNVALYSISALSGAGSNIGYTFSSVSGSGVGLVSPAAGTMTGVESGEFTLPAASSGFALGVNVSTPIANGSAVVINAGLYAYNV